MPLVKILLLVVCFCSVLSIRKQLMSSTNKTNIQRGIAGDYSVLVENDLTRKDFATQKEYEEFIQFDF